MLCMLHVGYRPPCGECGAGDGDPQRLAWMRWAQVYGDAPLTLRYADLSSDAQYTVRIVYAYQGWNERPLARLSAIGPGGASAMLHDYLPSPKPMRPLEFAIPRNVSAAGQLAIECRQPPGAA